MDGWKRCFTYAWPAGILQKIRETGEDINLYIFNSSGDWSLDKDYSVGEYNIYHLPDLNDFDGIILDLNNVRYEEVRRHIVEEAKKTKKPVISVAIELEDFYYVGIDNYAAMWKMIEHLHQHHGCKKFWFVMGPEENYENQMRTRALQDYVKEHHLDYSDNDVYFENFEYHCGYSGFCALYDLHDGQMPDAIVCANDNIAVGVCEAAAKEGYYAPKDFCVTGFDDFDKAAYYIPRISTVSHVREDVGYKCVEIFLELWKGNEVQRFNYTETRPVFSESCGCEFHVAMEQRQHGREQIMYEIETTDFEEQILSLENELMRCKSIKEMTNWIPKCVPSMNCDAMYVVIDDHINDFRKQLDYYDRHLIEDEEFHIAGYPEQMTVEFAYEDGRNTEIEGQHICSLFPTFDYEKGGTDFLFMPLHFRNRTVGYFAIRNAVYLMEKQFLFKVLNTLASAMENLHKTEKLEYMNSVLSDLYVKDSMTGMYNRLGYQKLACELFEEKKAKKENLVIMFLDMDRLKYINDHFGHEFGDFAIKTIANAIMTYCPKESVPVRTGGDEFVVIHQMMDELEAKDIEQNIRNQIQEKAEKMQFPFPLTVSIGCITTDMNTDKTLGDYIREADEIMYEEKAAKKVNRS